jgi:hypothetical protein
VKLPSPKATRAAIVAVVATAVVVVIGGGLAWVVHTQSGGTSAPAVPWVDRPALAPPEPRYPDPPSAAPCRADQLRGSVETSALAGMFLARVMVTNTDSTACDIRGTPTVTGLRRDSLAEPITIGEGDPAWIALDLARYRPMDLPPGGLATMTLLIPYSAYVNDGQRCSALNPDRPPPYDSLELGMPTGATVAVPGSAADIECGPFASLLTRGFLVNGSDRPLPEPVDRLKVSIEAPPSVEGGTTLHFVVVLRNDTADPIPLDPCPGYRVYGFDQVGRSGVERQLNCDSVHEIGPGSSVRFAMEFPVPEVLGNQGLYWAFRTPSPEAAYVTVQVR